MIQRKQTIYLLLAGIAGIVLFFVPFATIQEQGNDFVFSISGIKSVTPGTHMGVSTMPLMIILSIITGLSFVTIFLYKNRSIQMKICVLAIILNFGIIGLILLHIFKIFAAGNVNPIAFILLFAMLVLLIFAYLGIRKDEKLVKSLDRIR